MRLVIFAVRVILPERRENKIVRLFYHRQKAINFILNDIILGTTGTLTIEKMYIY